MESLSQKSLGGAMFQLLYVSTATKPFNTFELISMLNEGRRRNATLNINGMMLYKNGGFVHLLEGQKTAVKTLHREISNDKCHTDLVTIFERECPKGVFNDWSMGFDSQTNTLCHTLPGFTTFLDTPLDSKHFINDPTLSYQFFYVFKHANFGSSFSLQNKS